MANQPRLAKNSLAHSFSAMLIIDVRHHVRIMFV